MRFLILVLVLALCGPTLGQPGGQREREQRLKGVGIKSQDERRRDGAQGGERRDLRQERMRPEEREKLRRDIEDVNRNMQGKR